MSGAPDIAGQMLETLAGPRYHDVHAVSSESTYHDLRRIAGFLMARQPPDHTLQATALVHEAYIKLVGGDVPDWKSRDHYFSTLVKAMRQILCDHARAKAASKRGGGRQRVTLTDFTPGLAEQFPPHRFDDLLEALERLGAANRAWGEVVYLRFFAGLTIEDTAEMMDVAPVTVRKYWQFARAWLLEALRHSEGMQHDPSPS